MSQLKLSSQLRRFLITGLTATGIDSVVYTLMLYLGMGFSPAKACGFIAAVSFAYNGHRRWTFSTHGSRKRMIGFAGLYISTFIINNLTNTLTLELLDVHLRTDNELKMVIASAFIVATGITAVVNFTMMKFFIFRPARPVTVPSEE